MRRNLQNELPSFDDARILSRLDGYWWQSTLTGREYGPFATVAAAIADMNENPDLELEEGESLLEAEDELGIADWIDPDTGAPAEEGVPHLRYE